MPINDDIFDKIMAHAVDLDRFASGTSRRVADYLDALSQELEDKIRAAGLDGKETVKRARQEALIAQARKSISKVYKTTVDYVNGHITELVDIEAKWLGKLIPTVFEVLVESVVLTPAQLKRLTDTTMLRGMPQKEWWDQQTTKLRNSFAQQVRLGVGAGETTDQIVSRIRGAATGKVRVVDIDGEKVIVQQRIGGIMSVSKRDAEALVRTSIQTVSNAVRDETIDANQDIVRARMAVATLDLRTTDLCKSRDGALWGLDGKPLSESPVKIDYPGPPPWHFNCRTTIVPITKSWKELGGKLKDGAEEKISDRERASMDGQVPAKLTYEQWLKTKPKSVQVEVLGPGRWQLWNDGKITFADLVDTSGRPLTLEQLRRRSGSV